MQLIINLRKIQYFSVKKLINLFNYKFYKKKYFFYVLKGYKHLKNIKKVDITERIKNDLFLLETIKVSRSDEILLCNKKTNLRKIINQFLNYKLMNYKYFNFRELIFFSFGCNSRLIFPMPSNWFPVFEKEDIRVNKIISLLLFYLICFYEVFKGISFAIGRLKNVFLESDLFLNEKNVFFMNLKKRSLPSLQSEDNADIINWYIDNFKKKDNPTNIYYDTNKLNNKKNYKFFYKGLNLQRKNFYDFKISYTQYFKYLFKILIILIKGLFNLLLNNNWNKILLFKELSIKKFFELNIDYSSNKYFFSMTSQSYKPLYTYEIEKKGGEVYIYYFSTNIFNFDKVQTLNLNNFTWKNIFFISKTLELEFLKNNKDLNVTTFDSINYFDKFYKIPVINKSLALFDMPAYRDYFYIKNYIIGFQSNFYSEKLIIEYLKDVTDICYKLGITILYKSKHHPEFWSSKYFRREFNKISNNPLFIKIPPDVAPIRIIKKTKITISMPNSTTSVICKNLKKKSFFYSKQDPLIKYDFNIESINNKDLLYKKIKELF